MKSRIILLSTTSYLAVASVAYAADMAPVLKAPPPPPVIASWTGFYIGVHGGVAGFNSKLNTTSPNVSFDPVCRPVGPCRLSDTSGAFGGQVGYNWQFQNWVVGVEGDGTWVNLRPSTFVPIFPTVASEKIDW